MLVTREAKKLLGQLIDELNAGFVLEGLLRFPTETDSHAIGTTDLEYYLSNFVGRKIILIVMPLTAPKE